MTRVKLNQFVAVTANGSGVASAKIGPTSAREVWYPDTVSVIDASGGVVNEASCVISTGDANTKRFRDSCVDGSTGDSTGKAQGAVKVGEFVWADWAGGDAGHSFKLTVIGESEV